MDIEEILGFFLVMALLALLVITIYTGFRVYRLYQEGAPPEILAQEVCYPVERAVSFTVEGIDLLLPSWGPTETLLSVLQAAGRFSVSLCQGIATHIFHGKKPPETPEKLTI